MVIEIGEIEGFDSMVHMEHMAVVSGQLRLAEQPLNLNWAILSSLSPNWGNLNSFSVL